MPPDVDPVHLFPARGADITITAAERVPFVVVFSGGPSDIEVQQGGRWETVAEGATSPALIGPLVPGTWVRVGGGEAVSALALWTPADVAAWSGPGLRGAVITDIAPTEEAVWVSTAGGGLGRWDGQAWQHAGRRDGLPSDRLRAVDAGDGALWIGGDGGLLRIDAEGERQQWRTPAPVHDIAALSDGTAWIAADIGALRWPGASRAAPEAGPCTTVRADPAGGWYLGCAVSWHLPEGAPLPDARPVVGVVAREGGQYLATATAIDLLGPDGQEPFHTVTDQRITALGQVGGALLVGLDPGPALLITEDGLRPLHPADGLPDAPATAIAPGPRADKAWLGTSRGLALVTEAGTATSLPLAPLAAGIAVHGISPDGASLAVAADSGLVWLGQRQPSGWSDLAAAVGAPASAVRRDPDGDWWAASGSALIRLHRGHLQRFEAGSAIGALEPTGRMMAVLTERGVRVWLSGASTLSPTLPIADVVAARGTPAGELWMATPTELVRWHEGATRRWPLPSTARDLSLSRWGALVATDGGLEGLVSPGAEALTHVVDASPPPTAVTWSRGQAAWINADGALILPDGLVVPEDVRRLAPGTRLWADARGLWLFGSDGLHRLNFAPRSPDRR